MREAQTLIELEEESRKIMYFNTDGVYLHKRLVYGIKNVFEIFQRVVRAKHWQN